MNKYEIVHKTGAISWSNIPYLSVDQSPWLPSYDIQMAQQVCYDDHAIYIHQVAKESNIRAEHTSEMAQVCEDSCMEFFISPVWDDIRYFNFEWNKNGCLYLGFRTGRDVAARLQIKDHVEYFSFSSNETADGWEIFYQIPLAFIQLFFPNYQLTPGTKLRANCYKCGDKTIHPHYLMWNPSTSDRPDFHRPQDFGQMVLV